MVRGEGPLRRRAADPLVDLSRQHEAAEAHAEIQRVELVSDHARLRQGAFQHHNERVKQNEREDDKIISVPAEKPFQGGQTVFLLSVLLLFRSPQQPGSRLLYFRR